MSDADRRLERIGFDDYFRAQLDALGTDLVVARIAIDHGESYSAWNAAGVCQAALVGRELDQIDAPIDRPQVGDWVAGRHAPDGSLLIERLLSRQTCLVRKAAGERLEAQVIAANVDVVGIVSGLGEGGSKVRDRRLINENRLRRYLAIVEQSGAQPVMILNKSDLHGDALRLASRLERSFPGIPVVLTSAANPGGLSGLEPWLKPGRTLALVGMSGVGKSTIVNALLGRPVQRVGDVRESDARGRHTTSHRELFAIENGALLIDTPGMREIGLWETEIADAFEDIAALVTECRFRDCRHATEPSCAIRAALESGALTDERWASFLHHEEKQRGLGNAPFSWSGRGRRR
jgi:ribosome biogenesis GTPase